MQFAFFSFKFSIREVQKDTLFKEDSKIFKKDLKGDV